MEKSKLCFILFIVLLFMILIVFFETYKIIQLEKKLVDAITQSVTIVPCSAACIDDERYPPKQMICAEEIDPTTANNYVNTYRRNQTNVSNITGFHISKKAIDVIFRRYATYNSITMDMYKQEDGRLGLIVKGIRSDSCDVKLNSSLNSSVFKIYSMCPKDCANY